MADNYMLDGDNYTEEEVLEAAEAKGLTIEDYISKYYPDNDLEPVKTVEGKGMLAGETELPSNLNVLTKKVKNTKDFVKDIFNTQDLVKEDDEKVTSRAAEKYFSLDAMLKRELKPYGGESDFREFANTLEEDLRAYFGDEKYEEYIKWDSGNGILPDNKKFKSDIEVEKKNRKRELTEQYIGINVPEEKQIEAYLALPSVIGDEKEVVIGGKTYKNPKELYNTLKKRDVELGTTKAIDFEADYLATANEAFNNDYEKYETDLAKYEKDNEPILKQQALLVEKFKKLGRVDENSSEQEISEYNALVVENNNLQDQLDQGVTNTLIETRNSLKTRFDDLISKADTFENTSIAATALGLDYSLGGRISLQLEKTFLAGGAVLGAGTMKLIGKLGEVKYPTEQDIKIQEALAQNYKNAINYYDEVGKEIETTLPTTIKVDDINSENVFEAAKQMLGNNAPSILVALGTSGTGALLTKGMSTTAALATRRKMANLGMGIFFEMEAGGKLGDIEVGEKYAAANIDALNAMLERDEKEGIVKTPDEILSIKQQISDNENALSFTGMQKAFSTTMYGGIASYAERLGTLSYMNGLTRTSKVYGAGLFKKTIRGAKGNIYNVGVELLEETATQLGHNLTDITVLGENKSMIEGLDADFLVNTAFTSLAIQGPSMGMNSYNALKGEVNTRREREESRVRTQELLQIQNRLKSGEKITSKERRELVKRKREILQEAELADITTVQKLSRMTPQEVTDLFETNRLRRETLKNLQELGADIDSQSEFNKKQKQKLIEKYNKHDSKREFLLGKPTTRNKKDIEATLKILGLEKGVDYDLGDEAEMAFQLGKYQLNQDVLKNIVGEEKVKIFKGENSKQKLEEYLKEKVKEGVISQEDANEALASNNYAMFVGNEYVLMEDIALEGIANGGASALFAASSPLHELLHRDLIKTGVVVDGKIVKSAENVVASIEDHLNSLSENNLIDKKNAKIIKNRIEQYKSKEGVDLEELITLVGDLKDQGIISRETMSLNYDLKRFIKLTAGKLLGDKNAFLGFNTIEDIFRYIDSFQNRAKDQTLVIPPDEKEEAKEIKESKGILNDITNLLPANVKTKKDYDTFIADPNRNKVLFDALKDNGVISNYVKSRAVSKEESDLILQEVTDRIIGLVGEGFNPEAKRADGTTVGRKGFGEYIFANTKFAKLVARKELATKEPTVSIDAKKPTKEGDVGFDVADIEQKTPEEAMIAKEKAKKEKTDEQKRNEFLKRVGFNKNVKNKIIDSVIKTFGVKLPEVTSKQFKLALQRAFENELKNVIQKEFGIGKNYDLFLKTLFPTVFKRLTPEQLTQIERRVPKVGEKIFATRRRITKKAEVERLQNEGLIAMDVDYKTGPWLSTKMKTPTIRQTMAFFRGKYETLDKTGKVIKTESIQDILGYTIGKSAFGPRKDSLAEAVAVELAFDSVLEVLKDPKVLERRQAIEVLQGREKADNYLAELAQKIRRNPNVKLSRAVDNNASERAYKIFAINRPAFLEKIREYGFDEAAIKRAYDEVYKEFNLRTFDNKTLRPVVVNSYTKMIKPFLKINERYKEGNQVFPQTLEEYVSTVDLADPDIAIAQWFKLNQNITSLFRNPKQLKQYREFLQNIVINIKEKYNLSDKELATMLIRSQSHMENGTQNPARSMAFYKNDGFAKGVLTLIYPNANTYVRAAYRKKNDPKKNVYSKITILDKKGKILDEFDILLEPTQGVTQDMVNNTVSKKEKAARKEASDFHWDVLNKFLEEASILVKDKGTKYSKNEIAMLSAGFLGNMKTSLRASALFKYAVLSPFDNNPKNYEYEHGIPALIMMLHLLDHHFAGNKVDLNKLKESYAVGAIHDSMNDNLGVIFKKRMHFDYKIYDIAPKRWYNMYMAAGATHGVIDIYSGEKHGELQAAAWKDIKKMKDKLEAKQAEEKTKLNKAVVQGRKTIKESKGITVLDFDDTLATTKSGVRATIPNPDGTPKPNRKVIFLAGGAGSGKSNVVKQLGLEDQGFKVVNQDISLEWLKKNSGLPADMRDLTKEQKSTLGKLQAEARRIAKRKMMKFKGQGGGVVVDGTGGSIKAMTKLVNEFKEKGYDVSMLFVETSLDVALERNKARKERSLLDIIVRKNHEAVQGNKDGFKEMFGKRFMQVNTDNLTMKDPMPLDLVSKMDDFVSGYEKRRLDAEEFASEGADLLAQGAEFDFSEFNVVMEGQTAPLFNKALKLQKKFGNEDMFVLTARPAESAPHIYEFLKANGLNIPLKNITGLANSTPEAKALWMADKVAEGYNDFYFADDALQNVQAVQNMLDQFDVKSKVQQAKVKFSKSMNKDFNDILENVTGIESKKRFSAIKARKRGESKGKFRFFIPPSHEDFVGLLYNFMGKGKEGNAHRDFFEQALIRPLNRAYRELNAAKQSIANDYKSLNKQFKDVKKKLIKKTPDGDFTYQDAIRVYLWDKHDHDIPGLSPTDQQNLVDLVMGDLELQAYAETLNVISKQDKYVAPTESWEAGDVRIDLDDATGRIGRKEFFTEFNENTDIIFSQENLNKIEAAYGADVVSAIKDMLYRIQTGQNRPSGQNALVNKFLNYLNGSVASTMFFNIRSAVLQQMSLVNFINFADNNMFAAAKAFANQSQYWTDWATIFNSDFMKQRRKGIQTDVNGAELAASVKNAKNPIQAAIKKLLELGFLPTQIGDNIAIATGGATFLRNRINTYLKQGLSQKEAEAKAFVDFEILAEATQQSARPDMVSQQQASPLGKVILAFQNVTSQFNRLGKKAFLDIKNRRITPGNQTQLQSDMSNLSRIAYYFAIQNLIFYSLQSALFMAMFDDDEDDEKFLKKKERMINGSIDSVLRGAGVWGAAIATLKNMAIKWHEQREKGYNADESAVLMEMLNVSPPLGIKARKIVNAEKTLNYNRKVIDEMETFDIDNPQWSAVTNYVEATTNVPLNRLYNKTQNVRESLNNQHSALERALMFGGWSKWNLGIEDVKKEKKKQKFSTKKKFESKKFPTKKFPTKKF